MTYSKKEKSIHKRTKVKNAHDRYANQEIAYLVPVKKLKKNKERLTKHSIRLVTRNEKAIRLFLKK